MKQFCILLLLFLPPSLRAQELLLKSFNVQQQDEDVLITWVIGKGNQCADVEVQHSTDSVNFNVVYTYPGICGSNDEAVSYTWLHVDPAPNKKNYYRIYLPGNGYSKILAVNHHVFEGAGYVAAPVPSTGPVTLFFRNSQNVPHTLMIFDINGREVQRITGITTDKVIIDNASLLKGIYFFRLVGDPSRSISGKIILL